MRSPDFQIVEAVPANLGIAYTLKELVELDIVAGRLVEVLQKHSNQNPGFIYITLTRENKHRH